LLLSEFDDMETRHAWQRFGDRADLEPDHPGWRFAPNQSTLSTGCLPKTHCQAIAAFNRDHDDGQASIPLSLR